MLGLSETYNGRYDLVVIGSDEVFNCCEISPWGFSKQMFGDGLNTDTVISYAASFGHSTIEKIKKYCIDKELRRYLENFQSISVRDKNSFEIISTLTGKQPLMHLDPVLVYDFRNEINKCDINLKDYIVIYTYPNRIKDKNEIQAIRNFAAKNNKKLVSIYCCYPWCDTVLLPQSPFHVLAYFKNADYVVTDTFHGTIFSIINKKKFGTIIRESNKQKLTSLLKHFSLEKRIINNLPSIGDVLNSHISYDEANKVIEYEIDRTNRYIKKNIDKCIKKKKS
jgi:hypothetical protein